MEQMELQQQVVIHEEKLKNVLQLILTPDFQFQNDCYFNSFLSHLSGKDNKELGEQLLQSPVIITWIPNALHHWENVKLPTLPICSFVLNLTALVSRNETSFVTYNLNNVYNRLFHLFQVQAGGVQPTVKLAYVKILSSLLEHKSGLEWIVSNNIWKDCLAFCLENETVYIIREGHRFIYNLLVKCVDFNEEFARLLVQEVYVKLNQQQYNANANSAFPQIDDDQLQKQLRPTLKLVIFLLNEFMGNDNQQQDYRAVHVLIRYHNLELYITNLKSLTTNVDLVYDLYAVLFYIKMFSLLLNTQEKFDYEMLLCAGSDVMKYISELMTVKHIITVIKLCHLADTLWNRLPKSRLPLLSSEPEHGRREPIRFQNQLIVFQITPMLGIQLIHIKSYKLDGDDLREDFISSLFRMLHEKTIRMGYMWRDILRSQVEGFEIAKFATMQLLKSINNYNKHRAIKIFQTLLYTFKDILISIKERPTMAELFVKNSSFIITAFEAMASFINKFEISWRDSVETICVMNNAIECINQPFWPPLVIVHALKLVDLSIEKFLPPDLALLVEEDSTTSMLGNMLSAKLYDVNWEIRDTTLEILHTIAKISNSKYPLFQTMILNLDIIPMIVTMTVNDSEGFVRASAIKCLQEMIQVPELWTKVLLCQELPQKMMLILRHETEGIVRTEAAALMRYIHEYQFFPKELMPQIYESMAMAATKDLHWEVKSNALDFWGKVVLNHLQEQGYIDKKFPDVTFSKEKRKIVNLTDDEVQSRLNKILRQLSDIGCLGVLVNAIEEDCDIEVSKKSLIKVKKIKHILNRYNMFDCYKHVTVPERKPMKETKAPSTSATIDFSEEILDQILDTNDINLLPNIYAHNEPASLYASQANDVKTEMKQVTPEFFIAFIQNDLDALIDQKVKWLNKMDDLSSLLDDMLKSYEVDVNTMDCY